MDRRAWWATVHVIAESDTTEGRIQHAHLLWEPRGQAEAKLKSGLHHHRLQVGALSWDSAPGASLPTSVTWGMLRPPQSVRGVTPEPHHKVGVLLTSESDVLSALLCRDHSHPGPCPLGWGGPASGRCPWVARG